MTAPAATRSESKAAALFELSRPSASEVHLIESGVGHHALVADGSRFYDLDRESHRVLASAIADGSSEAALARLQLAAPRRAVDDRPVVRPPVRALSLAVAQKCNLGCTYCYAREGSFGAGPQSMAAATARAAVDLLVSQAAPGERVNPS